jgi:type IV pilus assembly protein PilQ
VNEGVAETGVPWFRKIPVFGWLFKNQEISQDNRELLIFITPKILRLS